MLLSVVALVTFAQNRSTMTDDQIISYIKTETQKGTNRSQIVKNLMEQGVTVDKIRSLRQRYEKEQKELTEPQKKTTAEQSRMRKRNTSEKQTDKSTGKEEKPQEYAGVDEEMEAALDELGLDEEEKPEDEKPVKVFGRDIFNNKKLSFEPNMNIATPQDYVLGPGDVVNIDIYGASQERISSTVSPDGTVDVSSYGPIQVDGLTVAKAGARLRSLLGARYGGSSIRLTLGQTRTITVDVMGEVKTPGSYTLSAFATVFNALYMAGGTNEIGTLRNICVYRRGRLISTCDIYDYILNGNMRGNVRLNSGDVIIVGPYECLVEVTGKVKRPMFYEMTSKESVGTLIKYAGGFTGDAFTGNVRLVRKAGNEMSVYTIDEFERNKFQLCDGDALEVDKALDRYKNMVEAKGAFMRPGMYQMDGSINSLRQLVEAAGGLSEEAVTSRAIIHRLKPDRTLSVIEVDIKGVMDNTVADVPLKNEDAVFVSSRKALLDAQQIAVYGEVQSPGEYEFAEGMTIEAAILQAGGFTDAASVMKVDVARRVRNSKASVVGATVAQTYSFQVKEGFVIDGQPGFQLEPFDEVFVRRSPGYVEQQHVRAIGELAFEGTYAIDRKGMRLSDLVTVAGGLTSYAYAHGAHLERIMTPEEKLKREQLVKLAMSQDSVTFSKLDLGDTYRVAIDLEKALQNPGDDNYDLRLEDQDKLIVPQASNTVNVNGEVMYPNSVVYVKNRPLSYYIDQAGGFGHRAKKSKIFAINMNGTVTRVRSAKDIEPGCTILVPSKKKRKGLSLTEILPLATTLSTLGLVISNIVQK